VPQPSTIRHSEIEAQAGRSLWQDAVLLREREAVFDQQSRRGLSGKGQAHITRTYSVAYSGQKPSILNNNAGEREHRTMACVMQDIDMQAEKQSHGKTLP